MNVIGFDSFCKGMENATFTYVRPYGIWHKGQVYWHKKLPRKPGTVVKYFEDPSGYVLSLIVLDIDGNYLANAPPIHWIEEGEPRLMKDIRDRLARGEEP